MSAIPKRRMTPEEYLAKERAAELPSEFFDGEMIPRAQANWAHTCIKDNLAVALNTQFLGSRYLAATCGLRVKIGATDAYAYPDVLVLCGEPELEDSFHDTLLNPQIVVEVLSPATEAFDRGEKFAYYRRIDSLQEYLLIAQDRPIIEQFVRDGDHWRVTQVSEPESLTLATAPAQIPLAVIYRSAKITSD